MTKQKYKLVNTDLTEEDLEDFEPEKTGLSTTIKILIGIVIVLIMFTLFVGGVYVGVVLKEMDIAAQNEEQQLGTMSVVGDTDTKVDYTTSDDTCVFILKFTKTGVYTCAITEVHGDNKSTRKIQTYIVKDLTTDYVCILTNYNATVDYEISIYESGVGA